MPQVYVNPNPVTDDFQSLDGFDALGKKAHHKLFDQCARNKCAHLFNELKRSTTRKQVIDLITQIESKNP